MIFDKIENIGLYNPDIKEWENTVKILKEYCADNFKKGATPCENGISVVGCEYETFDEQRAKMEAHKKFADLMFMVEGEEYLLYCPLSELSEVDKPYSEDIEAALFIRNGDEAKLHLKKGYFALFLPDDAHSAGIAVGKSQKVRRIVIKIPLE